jgi:hypothetical protein
MKMNKTTKMKRNKPQRTQSNTKGEEGKERGRGATYKGERTNLQGEGARGGGSTCKKGLIILDLLYFLSFVFLSVLCG